MTGNQSGNETARNLVPETRRSYVRLGPPMPGCREDREGSVVACERSQLHFKRRILGSRECESAGIDRDENGVNALLGVSYSIDSGGTVSQRSCAHKLSLHDSQLFDLVTLPADIPPNRGAPKHYTGAMHAVEFDRSIPNRRNRPPQPSVMALLSQQSCKRMRG